MRSLSGSLVRETRESKGLSRPQLAQIAGTSIDTIKRVELGSNEPGANVAAAIAVALGVPLDSLFTDSEAVA